MKAYNMETKTLRCKESNTIFWWEQFFINHQEPEKYADLAISPTKSVFKKIRQVFIENCLPLQKLETTSNNKLLIKYKQKQQDSWLTSTRKHLLSI